MTTDQDSLVEDALLMRELKKQLKGLTIHLDVHDFAGGDMFGPNGYRASREDQTQLRRIWDRITLEANQGI